MRSLREWCSPAPGEFERLAVKVAYENRLVSSYGVLWFDWGISRAEDNRTIGTGSWFGTCAASDCCSHVAVSCVMPAEGASRYLIINLRHEYARLW